MARQLVDDKKGTESMLWSFSEVKKMKILKIFRPLIILTNAEMEEYYSNMALEGWNLCKSTTVADFYEKGEKQKEYFCVIPAQAEICSGYDTELTLLGKHEWYQVYRKQKQGKIDYKLSEDAIKKLKFRLIAGFFALLFLFYVMMITSENQFKIVGFPWIIIYSISALGELFAWCWGSLRRIKEAKNYKQENIKIIPSSYKIITNIQKLVTLNHFVLVVSLIFYR